MLVLALIIFALVLQLQNTDDISSINSILATMEWLSLAVISCDNCLFVHVASVGASSAEAASTAVDCQPVPYRGAQPSHPPPDQAQSGCTSDAVMQQHTTPEAEEHQQSTDDDVSVHDVWTNEETKYLIRLMEEHVKAEDGLPATFGRIRAENKVRTWEKEGDVAKSGHAVGSSIWSAV